MYIRCVYWYSCKKAGPDPSLLRWHLDADQGGPGPNDGKSALQPLKTGVQAKPDDVLGIFAAVSLHSAKIELDLKIPLAP